MVSPFFQLPRSETLKSSLTLTNPIYYSFEIYPESDQSPLTPWISPRPGHCHLIWINQLGALLYPCLRIYPFRLFHSDQKPHVVLYFCQRPYSPWKTMAYEVLCELLHCILTQLNVIFLPCPFCCSDTALITVPETYRVYFYLDAPAEVLLSALYFLICCLASHGIQFLPSFRTLFQMPT